MSSIPSHYSERYVDRRYNKALDIVQHLPSSSSVQPSKDQKLELYALYKQVSHGNVDTQRPGIFDVVGRAKWDAWKRLKGTRRLEAKHRYVDTLLKVAAEAYRRPASKAQAQQIIEAFATIRPSGDNDSDAFLDSDEDMGSDDDGDEGSSMASAEAEEQEYLLNIKRSDTMTSSKATAVGIVPARSTTSTVRGETYGSPSVGPHARPDLQRSWDDARGARASSVTSSQSTMSAATAPSGRHRTSHTTPISTATAGAGASGMRPQSVSSARSTRSTHDRRPLLTPQRERAGLRVLPSESLFNAHIDDSVNPWIQHASLRRSQPDQDDHSADSIDDEREADSRLSAAFSQRTDTTIPNSRSQATMQPHARSSMFGSNTSLTTAATAPVGSDGAVAGFSRPTSRQRRHITNRLFGTDRPMGTVVGLDPATRQALEGLQSEILALNERMDGLRREQMERDQRRMPAGGLNRLSNTASGDGDEVWEGWRWVIKAALKHAVINLVTALVLVFVLYRTGSPVATVIVAHFRKNWYKIRMMRRLIL